VNDMLARGRFPMGSKAGTAKLTDEQVFEIRKLISQKISDSEIGRRYNVKAQTIRSIRLGQSWASLA
jgi:IS30 family transposase